MKNYEVNQKGLGESWKNLTEKWCTSTEAKLKPTRGEWFGAVEKMGG